MLASFALAFLVQDGARNSVTIPSSAILIVLDDVAMADLALYGGRVEMPYLEQLARVGVNFTRAYAMPTCAPTRRVMQTGHWWASGSGNPCEPETSAWPTLDEVFLPEALPSHQAAFFGKWHLGGDLFGLSPACAPLAHGYEQFVCGTPSNVNACGGSSYTHWVRMDAGPGGCTVAQARSYQPRDVKDAFRAAWRITRGPRFAVVNSNLAHSPFHDPPPDLLPPGYTFPRTGRGRFEAMLRAQDTLIGQMLAGIPLEDTLIVVIGDNGTPAEVAPDPDKAKTTVFERGVRVPFVIAGGGVRKGVTSDSLVHAIDVYATVIDLLGEPVPAFSGPYPVASVSLRPLLMGASGPVRSKALLATRWGSTEGELGAVTATRKLRQVDADGDRVIEFEQLFDLTLDPGESVDVASDPAYAADLNSLRAFIAATAVP